MSPTYLGEFPVTTSDHPWLAKFAEKEWAIYYIGRYGGFDGDHHKAWVLDQVSRILHGTPVIATEARWDDGQRDLRVRLAEPTPAYLLWRDEQQGETDEDGEREYSYNYGVPP